jgi:hypothetical protein
MPQQIDWSDLKAAAIALGSVHAAAKQAAVNLPESEATRLINRIDKRGYREQWLKSSRALATAAPTNAKPLSKPVQTGAETLATALAHNKQRSKLGLSTYAAEAAEEAAKHPKKLKIARAVRDVSAVAASLWPVEAEPGILNVAVLCAPVARVKQVEGEVIESAPTD